MIIADTDVLIDFLNGKSPGADWVSREIERGTLRTTAVNQFELLAGAKTSKQELQVQELLAVLAPLALSSDDARQAAALRRSLEEGGRGIGMADYLIAGIVMRHGASLMTRNIRHFGRIEGLALL